MKPDAPQHETGAPPEASESETTGLPGFRTWPAIYWFVTGVFAVMVVLLTALTRMFS